MHTFLKNYSLKIETEACVTKAKNL